MGCKFGVGFKRAGARFPPAKNRLGGNDELGSQRVDYFKVIANVDELQAPVGGVGVGHCDVEGKVLSRTDGVGNLRSKWGDRNGDLRIEVILNRAADV